MQMALTKESLTTLATLTNVLVSSNGSMYYDWGRGSDRFPNSGSVQILLIRPFYYFSGITMTENFFIVIFFGVKDS